MSKEKISQLYTLDNFIVEKSNQLAYSSIQNIAESSFVILYGENSIGKTHLLQAMKNLFLEKNKYVVYITSEMYTNDMLNHIKNMIMEKFRNKYRNCDLLLVDDIQYLSNKEGVQEEFYHTLEARKFAGKNTILASNKHPRHLNGITEDLASQLSAILSIDIGLPNKKTMKMIAERKCIDKSITLDKKTIALIVSRSEKNINRLEGIILKLKAYSTLMAMDVNFKIAKKVLKSDKKITKSKKKSKVK